MKKIIFSLALLTIYSVFALDITEKIELDLKVTPKTLIRTDYTIVSKFGEYFRTPSVKFAYKYDSSGKIIESSELNARDVLVNKIVDAYNSDGFLVGETCFDAENSKIWNTEIIYKDGKKVESAGYSKAGILKGKTLYSYTNDNLTDESYYDEEGAIVWKIVRSYNSKGMIESESEYSADGMLSEERRYEYNPNNTLDSISYNNEKGILTSKDVCRYDNNASLYEITTYNADNKTIKRTLVKYDAQGNIAKVTVYNVARKFGTTVNEMAEMSEFAYEY
ncbi:MAG: hypothetical protein HDR51_01630 [Treponema sp.]|nr:hypothetical protein [Treponema sp.]MBD5411436.1 hypothetical protein [Treponema sp.]MDE6244622.1 hypothetical protein [Treponemataceae bacterium]MDE7383614.1 hypothetical protein [Treponemataceae bacterium]